MPDLHVVFGAGQVGYPLAHQLLSAGKRVRIARRSASKVPPGCDVVAIATNVDPAQPGLMARLIAATPFAEPDYELRQWPTAFVVRRVAR